MKNQSQPAGITIYGQMAIDHIVDINQLLRLGPVKNILKIGDDGELIFTPESYIATEEAYVPWFFGPLTTYQPGFKYWATEVTRFTARILKISNKGQGLIQQLGVPNKELGGGGPNNVKLLFQVFKKFPIQFIGTYRQRPPEEPGSDIWEYVLDSMVSKLDLIPLHENPPINICFEGVGPKMEDRTIIRSPFPSLSLDRLEGIEWPQAEGSTIVVNTIYTTTLAVEALIAATRNAKLAVIACTEALCSKKIFSESECEYFQNKYPMVNFSVTNSLYDIILKYVLPNSSAILILNENELQHLTEAQVIDERGHRFLGGVFKGLKQLREYQGSKKGKIFFTMGKAGSLCCLDEDGVLHHCGITDMAGPIAGKTAIGDIYAGMVIGYEHIKNVIQNEITNVAYQIIAATAAADVGVAKGLRAVNVLGVDSGIIETWQKYTKLGPLDLVSNKAEKLYGPLEKLRLEDVDWSKISVIDDPEKQKQSGPTFLEADIGRQWLRPPYANHVDQKKAYS